MNPRERVLAALTHQMPDRVPLFEIWIDALSDELGQGDATAAYAETGQDCVMLPSHTPAGSNAWRTGADEWGRVWQDGVYVSGLVDSEADLARYSPPVSYAVQCFDAEQARIVRERYAEHCLIYGTHIGPFMAAYMAMGFERFFFRLIDEPAFVHRLLDLRSAWCIALFQEAVRLGAEALVLGDDAGHKQGPMISPEMWREFILPQHRRIVEAAPVPVIWHSDGNVEALLPMAVEAGFAGFHGLEPAAEMDLAAIKAQFGQDLALIGNVDVQVLCSDDLVAVRREVDRCLAQGMPGGGYMLSSCNSIFAGMNAAAVAEMYRYAGAAGVY